MDGYNAHRQSDAKVSSLNSPRSTRHARAAHAASVALVDSWARLAALVSEPRTRLFDAVSGTTAPRKLVIADAPYLSTECATCVFNVCLFCCVYVQI